MTPPKPWTYYNDGERCGIVLDVKPEYHFGGAPPSTCIKLAERGDILCVSTDDPLVKPGAPAYCLNLHDMRSGWISVGPHVLLAGTFVEAKAERDASGNRLVSVKLGGNLFPAPQAWVPSELLALEDALRTQEQELHTASIAAIVTQPVQTLSRLTCTHTTTQEPTEPTRELVMHPLDEPAATYWRAIQTARNAINDADDRFRQAREIRWCGDEPAEHLPDFDSRACCRLLAALRKELPVMPATGAALDGGCANCGEASC